MPSVMTRPHLQIDDRGPIPFVIDEWIGEAANHIWLIRAGIASVNDQGDESFAGSLAGLSIAVVSQSANTSPTQTILRVPQLTSIHGPGPMAAGRGTQAAPSWWGGSPCDYYNYFNNTSPKTPSFAVATWNGITACGPNAQLGR